MAKCCAVCKKETEEAIQCEFCHSGPFYCGQDCLARAREQGHDEVCAKLPAGWAVNFIWSVPEPGSGRKGMRTIWEERGAIPRDSGYHLGVEWLVPDDMNPFKDMVADCAVFIQAVKYLSDHPGSEEGKHPEDLSFFTGGSDFRSLFPEKHVVIPAAAGREEEILAVDYLSFKDEHGRTPLGLTIYTAGIGQWYLGPDKNGRLLGLGKRGAARMFPEEWATMLAETVCDDSRKLPDSPPCKQAVYMIGKHISDTSKWGDIYAKERNVTAGDPEIGQDPEGDGKSKTLYLIPFDLQGGDPLSELSHKAPAARMALRPAGNGTYVRQGPDGILEKTMQGWVDAACENMQKQAFEMNKGRVFYDWPSILHMFSFALRDPAHWKLMDKIPEWKGAE